jgi:hypothetical protein
VAVAATVIAARVAMAETVAPVATATTVDRVVIGAKAAATAARAVKVVETKAPRPSSLPPS